MFVPIFSIPYPDFNGRNSGRVSFKSFIRTAKG